MSDVHEEMEVTDAIRREESQCPLCSTIKSTGAFVIAPIEFGLKEVTGALDDCTGFLKDIVKDD